MTTTNNSTSSNGTAVATSDGTTSDTTAITLLFSGGEQFMFIPFIYLFLFIFLLLKILHLRSNLLIFEINQSFLPFLIALFYLPLALISNFYIFLNSNLNVNSNTAINSNNYTLQFSNDEFNIKKYLMFYSLINYSLLFLLLNSKPKRTPDDAAGSGEKLLYSDDEKKFKKISFILLAVLYAGQSTLFRYSSTEKLFFDLKIISCWITIFGQVGICTYLGILKNKNEIYGISKKIKNEIMEEFGKTKNLLFKNCLKLTILSFLGTAIFGIYNTNMVIYNFYYCPILIHGLIAATLYGYFVFAFYNFYYQKDVLDGRRSKVRIYYWFSLIPSFYYEKRRLRVVPTMEEEVTTTTTTIEEEVNNGHEKTD